MAEKSCVKDLSTQNLEVKKSCFLNGKLQGNKIPILRLSDFGSVQFKNLDVSESGSIILLDLSSISGGKISIYLPEITSNDIGVNYTFIQTVDVDYNTNQYIRTKYNNDKFVGGVKLLHNGTVSTNNDTNAKNFVSSNNKKIILLSGSKSSSGIGIGCYIKCVAILEGNTSSTSDDKLVWAVTGQVASAGASSSGQALLYS